MFSKFYLLKQMKQYSPNEVGTNGTSEVWASLRFQSISTLSPPPFHISHFSSSCPPFSHIRFFSVPSYTWSSVPLYVCACFFSPWSPCLSPLSKLANSSYWSFKIQLKCYLLWAPFSSSSDEIGCCEKNILV